MFARALRQRGQATVEHVGLVVLVALLLLALTTLLTRSLHPTAAAPGLVGDIAERLADPLEGGGAPWSAPPESPAPDLPAPPSAVWPRDPHQPLEPIWVWLNLRRHNNRVGRWLDAAKDYVWERLPEAGVECLKGAFSLGALGKLGGKAVDRVVGRLPRVPDITGLGRGGAGRMAGRLGRMAKVVLDPRSAAVGCAAGAIGAFLPD